MPHAQTESAQAPASTFDIAHRLERGRKHTKLAHDQMWDRFGEVIQAGASAAASSRGLPTKHQVQAWQRALGEAMKAYLNPAPKGTKAPKASKDVAAAQVAFAVGWVTGTEGNDAELLAQLSESPEISFGMAPDLQSIASAEALLEIFPARWHAMLADERVQPREISPTRWAIELLPEVHPAASLTGVQRWKEDLPGLNNAIAEVLKKSPPDLAARFSMDNAREVAGSTSRNQALDHVSAAAQSLYPPILADGTLAETPSQRTVALVLPAGLSRQEIESTARLAHAGAKAPTSVTVFVPDARENGQSSRRRRPTPADTDVEDLLAKDAFSPGHTYSVIIGQLFRVPVRVSTKAPDQEQIASWLPQPKNDPKMSQEPPADDGVAQERTPEVSEPEAQSPQEQALLARLDRAKIHASLAEEMLDPELVKWVNTGRQAAIEMAEADPVTAVSHYFKIVQQSIQEREMDSEVRGYKDADLTAAMGMGWVQGSESSALLARLRARPSLGLKAMPPDVQHLSRLFATEARLNPAQVAKLNDERVVLRYARQGHFSEVLPVDMPSRHLHEIVDAHCPQPHDQSGTSMNDVEPDTYSSRLYFLGSNARPKMDRENKIVGEYCDAVSLFYPPITSKGEPMVEADERQLVVKQRDGLDPKELIESAHLVMLEPTAVDVHTPSGDNQGSLTKWQDDFGAGTVTFRPIQPPSAKAEVAPDKDAAPPAAQTFGPNGPTVAGLGTMFIYTPAGLRSSGQTVR